MHLGKFHYAVDLIDKDLTHHEMPQRLANVINHLNSAASNLGNTDIAKAFKDHLDTFCQALADSPLNSPYPTLVQMLKHMGADKYIGNSFFERRKAGYALPVNHQSALAKRAMGCINEFGKEGDLRAAGPLDGRLLTMPRE